MTNTVSSETTASHADEIGHGNSPAAWTCVAIMLVGALVSSIAFVLASSPVFWGGIAVMVIGLIVGFALRKAGYGVGGSKLKNGH
ncbi:MULTISPECIES: HGxxPAAW family protein [Arthrobacter]|uniref:HGxxPAAW family protein n=2 Tax=Arthrobacter TaxID=1663 RepID=A0ABU9KG83_9MICC|nr:HGxxPAAW family protein [Arthrobacter sp. YJM1]MDP5225912.1 HGxxPAAW family protein [Arthrobacter sp. YJM1]